ncbi:MAG: chaperone modulator CbpM [Gammaproteobacteria bacterium]|nr:chaperone modulator CbpM [Gammaproteobacteria bacterium]
MSKELMTILGELIDESHEFSLGELCRICDVHAEVIMTLVEEGIVEPLGDEPATWRFPGPALKRVEIALHLQRDLDVNLPGVALVVELLEERESLLRRLRALEE